MSEQNYLNDYYKDSDQSSVVDTLADTFSTLEEQYSLDSHFKHSTTF